MHPARPQVPLRPCPACGTPTDPLRAGRVAVFEDGFRYLCDASCHTRYLAGERDHDTSRGFRVPPRSEPSAPPARRVGEPPPRPATMAIQLADPVEPPWVGLGAAAVALLLAAIPGPFAIALASAAATVGACGLALRASWPSRLEVGWMAWTLGPAGASLAGIAALIAHYDGGSRWGLAGAAVAAAVMVGRSWLDARMRRPVDEALAELLQPIPVDVRVPVKDAANPFDVGVAYTRTAHVRTGEEVLAFEGEVVAVDGVVKAGQAWAILHPGGRTPVRRVPGDPLLAGARIVEGDVRLLATRVGDDRALVRPRRFGRGSGPEAAAIARAAEQLSRWGGLAALVGAAGALALADADGLSAAAAVLVAVPLLAARRSAEAPLVAAAATAGARGIVYQNARTLDAAGRVAVAAFCTHGTVTEGDPEVVDVKAVDRSGDVRPLIALASAAEAAAEGHPISNAIRRLADERGIAPQSVRRATFLPGRGVTALGPGGEALVIGNRALLLDEGVGVAVADADAAHAEARADTALFMGVGGRAQAVFALQHEVRLGARAAVQRLFDLGVEVVLLSGDHRATVEALARRLDVTHVKAELLPEERGAEVRRLRETGGMVAAVGHPREDDEALSAADVPVTLGAAGAPAGERGVALASDDVRDAAAAIWIAHAARREAWRAVTLSVGAGVVLVSLAVLGIAGPAAAALLAAGVDAFALPAAARLLRRIERRVPARG